jgi:hypothetical protein
MTEVSSTSVITQPLNSQHADLPDTLELLPVPHQQHLELTHQASTYPITQFRSIIDAIPSVVNIERVDYSVLQQYNFTSDADLAALQAQVGKSNGRVTELAQFFN